MSWTDDLKKLRRYLRDPNGNIWSEAFLRHQYNDVQQNFQTRTNLLEDIAIQRVPGLYQGAYLYSWEWPYLGVTRGYQCLTLHDDFSLCSAWEAQEITGVSSDATDHGAHFTQPWEAYMTTPGDPVKVRFPKNLGTLTFIAYDDDLIEGTSKKRVQSRDSSYVRTQGSPTHFYPYDQDDYVLYPRPSVAFYNEVEGEGVAVFADGDTEDVTTGTVAVRTATYDSVDGVSVDILDSTNNLFMVYRATPTDIEAGGDESDFPAFLRKYILFGVAGRAYAANTDGKIRSLGELWEARYELGVALTRRYLLNRRQDRDYRLSPRTSRRPMGRPRLPDTYPAI